jgi:hypothetical protein
MRASQLMAMALDLPNSYFADDVPCLRSGEVQLLSTKTKPKKLDFAAGLQATWEMVT